jgi:hypothetical protein
LNPRSSLLRLAPALAAAGLLAAALSADQSNTGLGSQSAPFLTWPADARTASMGQAGVASVADVNAADLNPAGLAGVKGEQFSLNQAFLFQGSDLENAAAAMGVFQQAAVGLNLTYLNVGTVDASTFSGGVITPAGSFNPYYYSVGLTYAQTLLPGLNLGANLKAVGENIDNAVAGTGALDLGGQYDFGQYTDALQGLRLGSSVQNLGPQLAGADLPTTWRTGVSYQLPVLDLRNSLLMNADAQVPVLATWGQTTFSVGAELRYGRFLSLRAGYQYLPDYGGVTGLTGITAGAGFGMNWWQVDYAWVPEGDLGLADQFSFSAKF